MARRRLTAALAAVFPPLAVLSSAHELYLRNQQDLDGALSVLHPFWVTAGAAALLGLALQRSARFAGARLALAACYTSGLAFVAWSFLRALPAGTHFGRWFLDTGVGAAAFAAAWLAATAAVFRRPGPRSLEPLLAVLAVAFGAREAALFATRLDRRPPPPPRDLVAAFGTGGDSARPNVYHLLLDGLQDELVEPCSPGGEAFEGFVRFHVRAPLRSTLPLLPAVFSGRWLVGEDAEARAREALVGEASLLRDLRKAGYGTVAFVPRFLYEKNASAFDLAVFHEQNARAADLAGLHAAAFLRLWASGTLPRSLAEKLARRSILGLDAALVRESEVQRLSSHAQPIVSHLSMESLLELEPRLPARGRYTFVHLLLPHNPYVLRSDCAHGGAPAAPVPTDLEQQTRCTLLLLHRFLETLRGLGRLEVSVVVVHGDHGSGEVLKDGRLVGDDGAWLRTALLVKPAGGRGRMRVGDEPAQLVDIAPTLLSVLEIGREAPFDGKVLGAALP